MKGYLRTGLLLLALVSSGAWAQSGSVTGTVTDADGDGVPGVTVVLTEASLAEITAGDGSFSFRGVAPGTYNVTFTLGDNTAATTIDVVAGEPANLDQVVDWDVSFAETITVYSASRRRERIVEAPAAVTVVAEEQIQKEGSHGQIPKLLEFTPGAAVTQSGLYDFNLNTRGFNSSLNRRVPALVDGRDPSVPFLGAQDWSSLSMPLEDMASAELVRGPSSALYGTNAFNGILNLTTKQARYSQGGSFRLTGGELSMKRGEIRWATELGNDWYFKTTGSYTESDDFFRSRNQSVEYAGLPMERIPVQREDDEILVAGMRVDKYFGRSYMTIEGGYADAAGPVAQTGIGRVQFLDVNRPWARFNFSHPNFNFLTYYNKRDASEQAALASGANLVLDSKIWATELQGNMGFANGKGQLVGGVSYRQEDIETNLTAAPIDEDREALFAQVDYDFTDNFSAVLAARWDDSSLHDSKVSPKLALVYAPTPNQTLRLTYNEAFQSPNYSEFFLRAPAGATPGLAAIMRAIEAAVGLPTGFLAPLGFELTPIIAFGNANLEVEEIKTWEVGYSGILGGKVYLTLDYYNSELENFVTDLLPGVNPTYANPYMVPSGVLPPQLAAAVQATINAFGPVGLTNNPLNPLGPAIVISYTNAGSADSQGIDLGLNYYINDEWTLDFTYSWFDFEVNSAALGDQLLPNAPENSLALGISYGTDRFDISFKGRWVDDFDWAAGIFTGPVPSYEVFDLASNYHINDHVSFGVSVANVFDDEHWESFGGDIIGRRALGNVTFSW